MQAPFQKVCAEQELKGTILSPEASTFGWPANQIDAFVAHLEQDDRFAGIELKISYSDYQPFRRMNVRLKNEIISLGLDHIRPAFTGEEITPTEFKQWLDEDEVIVLDTRNDYECRVGTFENALELDIQVLDSFQNCVRDVRRVKRQACGDVLYRWYSM